jgi:hypothetical protein
VNDLEIFSILSIVILVIAIFFVISIIRKLIKLAIFAVIILAVVSLVANGVIQDDFLKIKEKIGSSKQIVLLEDNGEIISGFVDNNEIMFFEDKELGQLTQYYNKKDFDMIVGENYKLFVVKMAAISGLQDVKVNNKQVSVKDIEGLLLSGGQIASITYEDFMTDLKMEKSDMKNGMFAYLYYNYIKITKAPVFFFNNYKEGNMIVYPETAFFKFVKLVPLAWIEEKINKLRDKITDNISQAGGNATAG